jgi:hypothetical protein
MKTMEEITRIEWSKVRSAPVFSNSMFLLDWMAGADGFEQAGTLNLRPEAAKTPAWKTSPLQG